MLTGRQDKRDIIEALEAGADDFLSKPFHLRELQLRLAKGVMSQWSHHPRSDDVSDSTAPLTGTTLGGKYRLEMQVNEGGMASVWLAVHLSLGINVAIKFMKPGISESPDYASFEREARAAAQLRSEHTVRVYDHGIAQDGAPYLVMEYLTGESLADCVHRSGAIPPPATAAIIAQVGRALSEAHERGIVHRDVKPENILLLDDHENPHGLAKLVDFGLARQHLDGKDTQRGGPISGTPNYMSPEYLRGQVAPNPHVDMWGLAATAFVALTGGLPFDGETLSEIMRKVCTAPLPTPSVVRPTLPKAVDEWFFKACARDPLERYQSVGELTAALTTACAPLRPLVPSASLSNGGGIRQADAFTATEPTTEPPPPVTLIDVGTPRDR
jgi:serine/threonine-protein kinase